jgi:hypothetical protein
LTKKETTFLEQVLLLQKRMVDDAAFIQNVESCHNEVEEALAMRVAITKERIQVQEEIFSLSMSAEDAIDN